ncbi:ankyrin repeat domain-containing protein SOWAHC [Siphateles boraxobius]|uniref:ankyrin repeat domain-containing protein SOWAHC n=1 Tax=Siphateles boraxobius TaxID=180520 RepID=UPI00406311C8
MGEISEASLLDYICSCGGKVKNSDLSKTYKHFINHSDLQLRAKYREEFKLIIDRIAVVKSENGEKYLIIKKKYRQLIKERKPCAGELIKQVHPIPQNELQVSNPVENHNPTAQKQPALVAWCSGPMITVTEASEPTQTDNSDSTLSPPAEAEKPEHLTEELSASDREDELDKDSGSKSESEQDEDCGGSLGSTAVALDPLEKEWIFSAASGKLSHLIQLLKQDSSLANKKVKIYIRIPLRWAAKHGKEDMTTVLAEAGADINTKAGYTPLHIAALHGHRHIFDLLVRTYGAKENLRDYSGHLAHHYLNLRDTQLGDHELSEVSECHSLTQAGERRNRKITSLFHSMKKWGSAEELAAVPEERTVAHQLMLPAFRPRKFSR